MSIGITARQNWEFDPEKRWSSVTYLGMLLVTKLVQYPAVHIK